MEALTGGKREEEATACTGRPSSMLVIVDIGIKPDCVDRLIGLVGADFEGPGWIGIVGDMTKIADLVRGESEARPLADTFDWMTGRGDEV